MYYDEHGRFTGAEPVGPAALDRYQWARDAALAAAEPFGYWWQRHMREHQAA